MLEIGTSGLMSGEGKPPAAIRSRSSALPRLYPIDRPIHRTKNEQRATTNAVPPTTTSAPKYPTPGMVTGPPGQYPEKSMEDRLTVVCAGALLLGALFAVSCRTTSKVEARSSETITTVAVAKATVQNLSHNLVLTAEFKPFQEVELMAKVAGYVKKIYVDVGDRVQQGQLLAVLEVPEMKDDVTKSQASVDHSQSEVARARDEVRRAESAHHAAHLAYERLAGVNKDRPGLVAQQEIDDAQGKDLIAEAQVAAANSSLAAAIHQVAVSQAELQRWKTLTDYTQVMAPFTGVITKRFADTGSMIQAGTASQTQAMPLVRLSENSLLRLILPVPESAVPRVHIGQQVEVKVPSMNRSFPGKVARFADKLQLSTRTMETEVDVPNSNLLLIPGMYAEVDLTMEQRLNALAVPITAIDLQNNEGAQGAPATATVMVVGSQQRLEQRRVTLGLETADEVEIRSGLQPGDLVVIGNRASLQSGERVNPKITTMAAVQEGQ
jgi:RND family efflux transporter MFP subunit